MANKNEIPEEENTPESNGNPEYDFYNLYMEYLENQQKLAFSFWADIVNNCWWWKK